LTGLINLDFADVKTIMTGAGTALMAIGEARGEDRAIQAARAAISSPLLEVSIEGARGVLLNVSGGSDLGLQEVNEAAKAISEAVDPSANIIFGAVVVPRPSPDVKITLIATGLRAEGVSQGGGSAYTGERQDRRDRPPSRSRYGQEPDLSDEDDDLDSPAFLRRRRFS
jgi:cell division protein FtsZ